MSKRTARIELVPAVIAVANPGPNEPEGRRSIRATEPHYLRLVAGNGETLAHSENYSTRSNARRASRAWVAAFRDVLATPTTERVHEVTR